MLAKEKGKHNERKRQISLKKEDITEERTKEILRLKRCGETYLDHLMESKDPSGEVKT